jgi:hypothetical protein
MVCDYKPQLLNQPKNKAANKETTVNQIYLTPGKVNYLIPEDGHIISSPKRACTPSEESLILKY